MRVIRFLFAVMVWMSTVGLLLVGGLWWVLVGVPSLLLWVAGGGTAAMLEQAAGGWGGVWVAPDWVAGMLALGSVVVHVLLVAGGLGLLGGAGTPTRVSDAEWERVRAAVERHRELGGGEGS